MKIIPSLLDKILHIFFSWAWATKLCNGIVIFQLDTGKRCKGVNCIGGEISRINRQRDSEFIGGGVVVDDKLYDCFEISIVFKKATNSKFCLYGITLFYLLQSQAGLNGAKRRTDLVWKPEVFYWNIFIKASLTLKDLFLSKSAFGLLTFGPEIKL